MKFKPLQDRIAVKPLDIEEKSKGGIIIPDTAKEKPTQGKVVAVGPGRRNEEGVLIPMELKVGDVIFYAKWGGTELNIEGEDIIIMKESDALGVITQVRETA